MPSPPSYVVEEEKRSAASSRRGGLPPTEYWQRQRISMRRGYYSTFCRIWQDGGKAPKGGIRPLIPLASPPGGGAPAGDGEGFRSPVLSLRGGAKPRRGNPSPAISVSCADSSPTGGAKLGLSGPHRPLPPPWGRCPRRGRRGIPFPRPQSLPLGEGGTAQP